MTNQDIAVPLWAMVTIVGAVVSQMVAGFAWAVRTDRETRLQAKAIQEVNSDVDHVQKDLDAIKLKESETLSRLSVIETDVKWIRASMEKK